MDDPAPDSETGCGRREVRWIVRPGDGPRLGDILERLGAIARGALDEGRVFLGKRRVGSAAVRVTTGDVVVVREARRSAAAGIVVIEQRGGLVAVNKPAALPTEPDRQGSAQSVRSQLALSLGLPEAELHAASRLDVGVSGVVLFAVSRQARAHVTALREKGAYQRRYVALCAGAPRPASGRWERALRDGARTRSAITEFRTLATLELEAGRLGPGAWRQAALLALDPVTGRTHQLRQHVAAGAGPILGDRRYGGPLRWCAADGSMCEIARPLLHARRLTLTDEEGSPWTVHAALPPALGAAWRALGGLDGAFSAVDD